MKKLLTFLFLSLTIVLLTLPLVALAEGATDTPVVGEPTQYDPFTWAYLATIAGATTLTTLIVQYTKVPLDKVWKIPTRLFVYLVAVVILIVATAFTTGLTVDSALMAVVNALIVSLTAYGAYEITFAKSDDK